MDCAGLMPCRLATCQEVAPPIWHSPLWVRRFAESVLQVQLDLVLLGNNLVRPSGRGVKT